MLTEIHGEQLVAQGLAESGEYVVEVFVNPETSKWTIIATLPSGMTCLLEAGAEWRSVQPKGKKGRSA
jgi:hypothetical protein